ncbi:rRNA-binding ribosome biosynthesis protein utp25 [Tieghemiomyces parasiticus]|uniref:U3 small nucleolar RNA-associated protein 25 n=1 Tax=Tieghemiomyces parasiticus TaxID=78921 RepID=A0A9W8DTM1_9FUNG|nr:rRNA-binding ribosome biosynthesis protein utp25 [Tieghemiomyces parasiticus]
MPRPKTRYSKAIPSRKGKTDSGKDGKLTSAERRRRIEEYGEVDPMISHADEGLDEAIFKAMNKGKYDFQIRVDQDGNEILSADDEPAKTGTEPTVDQDSDNDEEFDEAAYDRDSLLARKKRRLRREQDLRRDVEFMRIGDNEVLSDDDLDYKQARDAVPIRHGLFVTSKVLNRPLASNGTQTDSHKRARWDDSDDSGTDFVDKKKAGGNPFETLVGMLKKDSAFADVYERQKLEENAREDYTEESASDSDVDGGGLGESGESEDGDPDHSIVGADELSEDAQSDVESPATGSDEDQSEGTSEEDEDDQDVDLEDQDAIDRYVQRYAEDNEVVDGRLEMELQDGPRSDEDSDAVTDDDADASDADETPEYVTPDYYMRHFGDDTYDALAPRLEQVKAKQTHTRTFQNDTLQHVTVTVYGDSEQDASLTEEWARIDQPLDNFSTMRLRERMQNPWRRVHGAKRRGPMPLLSYHNDLEVQLFRLMDTYRDLLYTQRTHTNSTQIRRAYALHAVNHLYKNRETLLNHSLAIRQARTAGPGAEAPDYRDQGFTRPKVLIILPFRNSAFEVVRLLTALAGKDQVENKAKFMGRFGVRAEDDTVDPTRPADYTANFRGNIDDYFRLGIKFMRRTDILFSPYYDSDVLIMSPLALRMAVGNLSAKKADYDYLSSIEMLIVDQCDAISMQNWEHLDFILKALNQMPKSAHNCDFSRVRRAYLDGHAAHFRQTLVFADYPTPELNALFRNQCLNVAGRIRVKCARYPGQLAEVRARIPQTFTRIPCDSVAAADDARFTYFSDVFLPNLTAANLTYSSVALMVPSYFDFVRVRNHLIQSGYNAAFLSEYSSPSDMARARTTFFNGQKNLLVFTERFHYFRRYRLRGIKHLVFYSLPDHAHYYPEVVNFMALTAIPQVKSLGDREEILRQTAQALSRAAKGEASDAEDWTCTTLFTSFDQMKLERIVGTDVAKKMVRGGKGTYTFV